MIINSRSRINYLDYDVWKTSGFLIFIVYEIFHTAIKIGGT